MPRQSQQAVTQLPQAEHSPTLQQLAVVARPVSSTVPSNPQDELSGLIDGLKSFNPALEKYATVNDQIDAAAAEEQGALAGRTSHLDPANVMQRPEALPETINPAFRPAFEAGYKKTLGQRLGLDSVASISAEYEKQKLTEGFDARAWLDQQFKQHSAGITDTTIANEIAKQHTDLSRHVLSEDNKVKLGQLKDSTISNVTSVMGGLVNAAQGDPVKLGDSMHQFLQTDTAWKQYLTRPEMSAKLVDLVIAKSVEGKGSPALFDALDKVKDPVIGKTIAETSPELALKIQQGRKYAESMLDQRIEKDSQKLNFQIMASVDDELGKGSKAFTDDWIATNTGGPGTLFPTTEAALAFRKKRDASLNSGDDMGYTLGLMKQGLGYLASEKQQKAAADFVTTPLVNEIIQIANDPSKLPMLNERMAAFAQVHADSKLSIGNEVLSRFVNSMAALPPSKDGKPSPQFLSAAAMYQTMPPNVRDLYFKDDAKKLFDHYTKEVNGATAPESAYQLAYQGISLEAKQREQELVKDPAWAANTQKVISGAVDGLKYQPTRDFVPFRDNLPSNLDLLTKGAGVMEAKRYMMAHPNMGEADLKDYMQGWVQRNYVHDTTTNMLVGVPAGVGQAGDKAISWFQEGLVKKYGADSRPTLVYMGNNQYQVQLLATNSVREVVSWDQLRGQHVTATALTDSDRAALTDLQKKATTGSLTGADMATYAPVLSKVRTLGLEDKVPLKEINAAYDKQMAAALAAIPKLTVGSASPVLGPNPNPANDRTSQQMSTTRFLGEKTPQGLAAALITQGEGVVLKASPDPAQGAGHNIGMGYNLKANAATLSEDFRKAGIPVEAIEDIKAGRKVITPEQAERLLVLTVPRYMAKAQDTIEKKYAGMWDKMTPQQKAVVTDVAYQVKDFSKFGPSIDALFSGDQEKIDQAFKVSYTDHSGSVRLDTRRNNLRANLLKGTSRFQAVALNN